MIRRRVRVSGRVQGVGFRASTLAAVKALSEALRGYVRNLPDGSVEAVFEGSAAAVEEMLQWCRKGPPSAIVDQCEVHPDDSDSELPVFEIKF